MARKPAPARRGGLAIVHHRDYLVPLRPGHRFPMSKYGYLRRALERRGLMAPGAYFAPAEATAEQVATAHDGGYVQRVIDRQLSAGEIRRIGLPGSAAVARRARLSSAGTFLAASLALERGIACNSAGGSHHAGPDYGAGYCVFNDVAVAIGNLFAGGGEGPVLVVDADVHQGDGTARIFEGDPRVFTFSIHAERNYPARKARSDLDVGLPDGVDDAAYLSALAAGLEQAMAVCRPALAFYNAGVDVWQGDRLGRLGLTEDGIRARDRLVIRTLHKAGVPVVGVVGGGYDDDPERLAERHAVLFEEAARVA